MSSPYSVFLRIEVLEALGQLKPRVRRDILHFAQTLASDPFLESDHTESDQEGLQLDIKIVGNLAVVYHVNHAEREARILDIQRVDR